MAVAKEIPKHLLDLVGIYVGWERGGTELAGTYAFLYGTGNENHELCTRFFYIRESYQQLAG
jgi:hypothetical protein